MASNILSGQPDRVVYCEIKGKEASIQNTRVLTRISGVVNLNLLKQPKIDFEERTIYSSGTPPIKFFSKIHVPSNLVPALGELFATVQDEDDLEQSTHILSDEGMDYFMGTQLIKLAVYLKQYQLIDFPDTTFFVSVNAESDFKTQNKTCENWKTSYKGFDKKYFVKKILETKTESQTFGRPGILWPGFDVAVGDCSAKNPYGTGYLFKTDNAFVPVNLCSNESAVDYCSQNNCLAYYTDFINDGKMRILSKYTPSINLNLQNDYKFRSSNI